MQIIVAGIPVTLHRKRVKYLRLRVTPAGVTLNVPWHCAMAVAETFAHAHADWINAHYHPHPTTMPTSVTLFGREMPVRLTVAARRSVSIEGDVVVVGIRQRDDATQVARSLQQWYAAQLAIVMAQLVPHWQQVMATPPVTWRIRSMRSRWGSCAPRTGKLAFATGLVHYPHDVIAYVVIHELAHLFHANHATPFWQCVAHYCPQWRMMRAALRHPAVMR